MLERIFSMRFQTASATTIAIKALRMRITTLEFLIERERLPSRTYNRKLLLYGHSRLAVDFKGPTPRGSRPPFAAVSGDIPRRHRRSARVPSADRGSSIR